MNPSRVVPLSILALLLLLGGCATAIRPVNPPITQVDPSGGYRFETRQAQNQGQGKEGLVILAFSGGGTRAAAFSYGVLEFLRRTEVMTPRGKARLLDEVDVITGVSGGSFTALAYGLYGDKLFTDYEQRFLKRDVQGEIVSRSFSPSNWGKLASTAWGRSELAAELYDEILFNNATFADLNRGKGPLIMASATDISTGSRFIFNQRVFDVICSDLGAVKLSRAASASSAVPVVLSPVTLNNYGGTCGATVPGFLKPFLDADNPPRPAARAIRSLRAEEAFRDGVHRPFLHLVDGGVSDNVGMRAVLDALEILEALHDARASRRHSTARAGSSSSSSIRCPRPRPTGTRRRAPRHRRHPAQGRRHPDRRLFLRGGRAPEGHRGEVANPASGPQFGGLRRQQGSCGGQGVARARSRDLRDRRVVPQAEGQGGAGLSQSSSPRRSCCRPRRSIGCARRRGRSSWTSPEFKRLLKDVGAKVVDDPRAAAAAASQ